MALDQKFQNPKRSSQDPTELNTRLDAIERRLSAIEKELKDNRKALQMEISDGLVWEERV